MAADTSGTAVVTGGARGIGREIARRLAEEGFRVVVLDVEDAGGTVEAIREDGGSGEHREVDVTDPRALREAFDGLDVDVLVNNAAVYAPLVENKRRFDEIDLEEWNRVLEVNVTGVFLASREALPRLGEGDRIVNVTSSSIELGVPGFLHYVASKAAVMGMTRSMASELGDVGIRVNAVMPGLTMSEATLQNDPDYVDELVSQQALDHRLQPEDVAAAVAFLAGPGAEGITGQVLSVDPGTVYR